MTVDSAAYCNGRPRRDGRWRPKRRRARVAGTGNSWRLVVSKPEHVERRAKWGIRDPKRIYDTDEPAPGKNHFCRHWRDLLKSASRRAILEKGMCTQRDSYARDAPGPIHRQCIWRKSAGREGVILVAGFAEDRRRPTPRLDFDRLPPKGPGADRPVQERHTGVELRWLRHGAGARDHRWNTRDRDRS